MTDRPILFSAPMVRALLAGRKTQTRRILKPQPILGYTPDVTASKGVRFAKGDRLWVREAVWLPEGSKEPRGHITYRADHGDDPVLKWRPGIHMPRWASRLTLIVTDVRVQRLQDISEADAIEEGAPSRPWEVAFGSDLPDGHRAGFCEIWTAINGDGAWARNDWVIALTFSVAHRNIDSAPMPEREERTDARSALSDTTGEE